MIVGQKWLGAEVFKLCADSGHEIVAVVTPFPYTNPIDRLRAAASRRAVPVLALGKTLDASIMPHGVDVILAAHSFAYIPRPAHDRAKFGALAFHPSLLPRHRGPSAIDWTIAQGERITGGTVFKLDDGYDTGPIVVQDWCHVRPEDNASTLWRRELAPMALRLFSRALDMLQRDDFRLKEQDNSLATCEPRYVGNATRRTSC